MKYKKARPQNKSSLCFKDELFVRDTTLIPNYFKPPSGEVSVFLCPPKGGLKYRTLDFSYNGHTRRNLIILTSLRLSFRGSSGDSRNNNACIIKL
ncbi:hypothetical protein A2V95_03785 [Candidatus Kuenenbacteria bacterium RBG_16_41_7]|uniref:Uncharacterized protein n=1 Tax=Candidatus Kuenenbacteria bacterium RBG_16_41_7 TaxID=1798560 RepID=A0A1F6GC96_9BACT|nr:MAG: hypothetical protein A2V95_03785 [Candidatus Kuenenbacteria bacterium RBG_16_41_7]